MGCDLKAAFFDPTSLKRYFKTSVYPGGKTQKWPAVQL
jgi:hypothetical protein